MCFIRLLLSGRISFEALSLNLCQMVHKTFCDGYQCCGLGNQYPRDRFCCSGLIRYSVPWKSAADTFCSSTAFDNSTF